MADRVMVMYTDSSRNDIGILKDYFLDNEQNEESKNNTFELVVKVGSNHGLGKGSFLYVEGTELGGRIDGLKYETDSNVVTFTGKTWRGLLADKIIEPAAGQDYFTYSTTASGAVADTMTKVGLTNIFLKGVVNSIPISYQCERYKDALYCISEALATKNLLLDLKYSGKKIVYNEIPVVTHKDVNGEQMRFDIETARNCNHIIGLGKGELRERQVVHYYIDQNGNISNTQYYTGENEIVRTYELSNAESINELRTATKNKLKEIATETSVKLTTYSLEANVGDIVTTTAFVPNADGYDAIIITQKVIKKITTIDNGVIRHQYDVGEIK